MTQVKICGITDVESLRAAMDAGADYIGLVFYKNSPRNITPQDARKLQSEIPGDVKTLGLFVDPSDKDLRETLSLVKLDMLQLHGDENPMRLIEIRAGFNLPVMKAIRVANAADIESAAKFEKIADWLLFDAKVEGRHGGTGQSFDWTLLKDKSFSKPWMLSGGLTPENVASALNILQPPAIDVSSGVEKTKGVKDPAKIRAFIEAVKNHGKS